MGRTRLTDAELAAQIAASISLEAADMSRGTKAQYDYWMNMAQHANDRTRLMMIDRDVTMFRRTERGSMGQ